MIVTDVAVLQVAEGGLELAELAPGWTADDVAALTAAPLAVSPGLREMTFDAPTLAWPNKVYAHRGRRPARRSGWRGRERGRLRRTGRHGPIT